MNISGILDISPVYIQYAFNISFNIVLNISENVGGVYVEFPMSWELGSYAQGNSGVRNPMMVPVRLALFPL